MSFSISKLGPYFVFGTISMEQIRQTYVPLNSSIVPSGPIRISNYIRNTNVNDPDPLVPDATENVNIPSSRRNIKFSSYRNSIRRYIITQSGTDLNANLSGQPWNANLGKNIQKRMIINGTCGSNSTGSYAASFSATAYNLMIMVYGNVLGAGGLGGTISSPSGKSGGPALYAASSGGSVRVVSAGPIYGGGGGGARGFDGAQGAPGTCYYTTEYDVGPNCGGCPDCNAGDQLLGCADVGSCNCNKKSCRSTQYGSRCLHYNYYAVPGAAGGIGGDGGRGEGYDGPATLGLSGTDGQIGGCVNNLGGNGDIGQPGGAGGLYGNDGQSRTRYDLTVYSGGPSGRSVTGGNYVIDDGTFGGNSAYLRGPY